MWVSLILGLGSLASQAIPSAANPLREPVRHLVTKSVNTNGIAFAENYATLRRTSKAPPSRLGRRRVALDSDPPKGTAPTNHTQPLRNAGDIYYIIDVSVQGNTIPLWLDTGSSETWFITGDYRCDVIGLGGANGGVGCGFGPGFNGTLPPRQPTEQFLIQYADGTYVVGSYVFANVTVAGITVPQQQIGLGRESYWNGDGQSSGLIGLAYPFLTTLSGTDNRPPYDPLFTTMWKDNLSAPAFSLALSRNHSAAQSYIAFGGLPPAAEFDDSTWVTAPLLPMGDLANTAADARAYGYYQIETQAFKTQTGTKDPVDLYAKTLPVVLDVGSTMTQLPADITNAIYRSFTPAARNDAGAMFARCDATAPRLGVQIANTTLWLDPGDLLSATFTSTDAQGAEWCRIEVTESDAAPYILGINFFSSVVAFFDVGSQQVSFAARKKY